MVRRATTRKPSERSAQPPPAYRPMAATLVDEPFDHPDWIFETKFDGLRVLARFDGEDLTLISRNDKAQETLFPDVTAALRAALTRPAFVDGEIVCFDAECRTSFRALQQRFHLLDPMLEMLTLDRLIRKRVDPQNNVYIDALMPYLGGASSGNWSLPIHDVTNFFRQGATVAPGGERHGPVHGAFRPLVPVIICSSIAA